MLVNNAAIAQVPTPGKSYAELSFEEMVNAGRPSVATVDEVRAVFETNVFGVIAVTQAMLRAPARGAGGPHRQRVERGRLAVAADGPSGTLSNDAGPLPC